MGCMVEEDYYGEVLPGIHLVRATKDYPDDEEGEESSWKAGQWGLTIQNDPMFVFDEVIADPGEEADMDHPYYKALDDFIDRAYVRIGQGLILGKAATEAGFDGKMCFESWLYDRIGEFVKTAKVRHHGDNNGTSETQG